MGMSHSTRQQPPLRKGGVHLVRPPNTHEEPVVIALAWGWVLVDNVDLRT